MFEHDIYSYVSHSLDQCRGMYIVRGIQEGGAVTDQRRWCSPGVRARTLLLWYVAKETDVPAAESARGIDPVIQRRKATSTLDLSSEQEQ